MIKLYYVLNILRQNQVKNKNIILNMMINKNKIQNIRLFSYYYNKYIIILFKFEYIL